jgi:hypothetical protein
VAPVLETRWHRFGQWWIFEQIFGGKVSLGKIRLGLNLHRVSSLFASGLDFSEVSK